MTSPASDSLSEIVARLDARVRRVDEERWLSSRYAKADARQTLIVLYAFYYELARVRVAVSDQTMGQIRFQWWRDALTELEQGAPRQHDVVLAIEREIRDGRLFIERLMPLIEQHEAAFLANDRDLEPETKLAEIAAEVCAPGETGSDSFSEIAADWARLRRQEPALQPLKRMKAPSSIRPAVAHFRLRHAWAQQKQIGPQQKRWSILWAVLSGWI